MKKNIKYMIMGWKVRFSRALSYLNLVNTGLILYLTIKTESLFGVSLDSMYIIFPIFLMLFIVLLFIGWLEDKTGFHKAEQDYNQTRNLRLIKMEKMLEELTNK